MGNEYVEILMAFLRKSESYQHFPGTVTIKETPISIIAAAPPFVYKIRKSILLPGSDFRDLAGRRNICEKELEIGRDFAPGVYQSVEPICVKNGELAFGRTEPVVEYALKMRLLPRSDRLNTALHRSDAEAVIDSVASYLSSFYQERRTNGRMDFFGQPGKIRERVQELCDMMDPYRHISFVSGFLDSFNSYVNRFIDRNGTFLLKRRDDGWIFNCHGELHSARISLFDGRVNIFGPMAYNDSFRCIDAAQDTAMLMVDLDFHGHQSLATRLCEKIEASLKDSCEKDLLNFYKSCAAARHALCRLQEAGLSGKASERSLSAAASYLKLGASYPSA